MNGAEYLSPCITEFTMRSLSICLLLIAVSSASVISADWPRFRGPNGSGVSDARDLPVEFRPEKNVLWKATVPPGHSSPVLAINDLNDECFATPAIADGKLYIRPRSGLYCFSQTAQTNTNALRNATKGKVNAPH